jgi:hypothetical protein
VITVADNHKRNALAVLAAVTLDLRGISFPTMQIIISTVIEIMMYLEVEISSDEGFEAVMLLEDTYEEARRNCPWKCRPGTHAACLCTTGVARALVDRFGK